MAVARPAGDASTPRRTRLRRRARGTPRGCSPGRRPSTPARPWAARPVPVPPMRRRPWGDLGPGLAGPLRAPEPRPPSVPRDAQRGRPVHGTPPDQGVSPLDGARALRIAAQQALRDPPRWCLLATHARDAPPLPPAGTVRRLARPSPRGTGGRFLPAPQLLAASRSLTTPERLMALLMVMTVCVRVSAARASRMRPALKPTFRTERPIWRHLYRYNQTERCPRSWRRGRCSSVRGRSMSPGPGMERPCIPTKSWNPQRAVGCWLRVPFWSGNVALCSLSRHSAPLMCN
jgi:hypothetical protein